MAKDAQYRNETESDPVGESGSKHLSEAITTAAGSLDWRSAKTLFDTFRALPNRSSRNLLLLAACVMDWVTVLQAEAAIIQKQGRSEASLLRPQLAELAFQARMQLRLEDEAIEVMRGLRQRFPNAPDEPKWANWEARALARMGDYEAALAIGLAQWEERRHPGATIVAQSLIALGRIEECERFVRSIPPWKRTPFLARARLACWTAGPYSDQTFAAVRTLKGQLPDAEYYVALARQAMLARDGDTLNTLLSEVRNWSIDPTQDALFRRASPGILLQHFQCLDNWPAVRSSAELLSRRALPPFAAVAVCSLAVRAGDYDLAERIILAAVQSFPSALQVWHQYMSVLTLKGELEVRAAARLKMKQTFPAKCYLTSWSLASPRSWDMEDLADMITFNLGPAAGARQTRFFASLGDAVLEEEQADLVRAAAVDSPPVITAQVNLILATLGDRRLLDTAVLSPVTFAQFDLTGVLVRETIAQVTKALATGEEEAATSQNGMAEALRLIGLLEESRRYPMLLSTRESYAEAVALGRLLVERIRARQATSVIRIGDGEGQFLPGHPSVAEYRDIDQSTIQQVWWGSDRMQGEVLQRIQQDFIESVENSDILAVIPAWRLMASMAITKQSRAHRGMLNVAYHCSSLDFRGQLIASAHFPNDLYNWNLWCEILSEVTSISYISCHDMSLFFRENFGIGTRESILIPQENDFAGLFQPGEASIVRSETLLGRHEAISDSINPRRGEVYFVAAGFLGKIYCNIIKNRGGIGIDIGSLADYWMGFSTRRYQLKPHSRVEVTNIFVDDHPLAGRGDRLRIAGVADIARSTRNCRYNIASDADKALINSAVREHRLLRVIGHPRCASGYMATLFTGAGLEIGHEKLLRHGISSWMHVVSDLHVPWGDNASWNVDFEHTVAHVRDPAEAIPSIIMENGSSPSFNFRRLHIMRATGQDLCDYRTALDRAVASLVYWYDMVMGQRPEAVFRVEDGEDAVRDYLARFNLIETLPGRQGASLRPSSSAQWLPEVEIASSTDDDGDSDDYEIASVNNSIRKFGRAKPVPTLDDYRSLDPELREHLGAYCDRFSYPIPWEMA